jgi:DNA-binding CsgD family transcriptional regulator
MVWAASGCREVWSAEVMTLSTEERSFADGSGGLQLSVREAQVLSLILRGLGNKEIAAELGLAEVSIKQYASALLRKFDVPNRAALTHAGLRLELAGTTELAPSWLPQLLRDSDLLVAVLAGPELRFVATSEAATRLLNRPLIGRPLREALPEYATSGLLDSVERVYATGEPLVEHARLVPFDPKRGSAGYRDFVMQALRDDAGRINGVVYFGIDVTEQVLATPPHNCARGYETDL